MWPDTVPPHLRVLVDECLQKNPKDRIADISTVRFVMNERHAALMATAPRQPATRHRFWTAAALLAVIAAVAGVILWSVWLRGNKVGTGVTRFSIQLEDGQELRSASSLTISPDGTQVIYVANHRLYRSMSELEALADRRNRE